MGYCLRDSKDCAVLNPLLAYSRFLHFYTRESQKYFTLKDIFGSNQLEVMLFTWVIFI